MRLSRPFLRVPRLFDAERLREEIEALPDSAWLTHPQGFAGNSAVPLISPGGEATDGLPGSIPLGETAALRSREYLRQVLASFSTPLSRTRLMRVDAGAEVPPHRDQAYHWFRRARFHIAVITDTRVLMSCGGESQHFAPGETWILDTSRVHSVINASDRARTHLVVDLVASADLLAATSSQEGAFEITSFAPGVAPEIPLEPPSLEVCAPDEMEALLALVRDEAAQTGSRLVTSGIKIRLTAFGAAWRTAFEREGRCLDAAPHYRHLVQEFQDDIYPRLDLRDGDGAWAAGVIRSMRSTLAGTR